MATIWKRKKEYLVARVLEADGFGPTFIAIGDHGGKLQLAFPDKESWRWLKPLLVGKQVLVLTARDGIGIPLDVELVAQLDRATGHSQFLQQAWVKLGRRLA